MLPVMAKPLTVTDGTFRERVVESSIPALVDFWASWNSTCKALAPSLDVLAEEYAGRVLIAKLDIDANPLTAGLFAVLAVPTLILFRGGEALTRINGYRPIDVLREELDHLLAAV
jgi:thioredoxin 1